MKKLKIIFVMTLVLISCSPKDNKPIEEKPFTEVQDIAKANSLKIEFNQPVFIADSVYVMYPLTIKNNEENNKIIGSSYKSEKKYWNIIFYNTENGDYHLLDEKRKMIIHSYYSKNSNIESESFSRNINDCLEKKVSQVDKLIYYSVKSFDLNNDGKLNTEDPNYLFISDKTGKNFRQVSPENFNVTSWQTIRETNKILIQATKDSDNDKKFTDNDEVIPLVYDLNPKGVTKDVFKDEFKVKLKKKLNEQWIQE